MSPRTNSFAVFSLILLFLFSAAVHAGADVEVLVRGAAISGANGLTVGPDGNLYVTSVLGQSITVLDADGNLLDRLDDLDGDGVIDVGTPDDVAFGADGSLYWTSLFTGEVGRLRPDGSFTTQFIAPGVNPITFSEDGRLFVALAFLGDALYELDPELMDPPRLVGEGYGFLNGFDFGPDGRLYSPVWNTGQVIAVDPETGAVDEVLQEGFGTPAGIDIDADGKIYGVDGLTGEFFRIDPETATSETLEWLDEGLDNIAIGPDGAVYVTNFGDGSVRRRLGDADSVEILAGGLIQPGGIAVLPRPNERESLFVADSFLMKQFDGRRGKERQAVRRPLLNTSVAESWTASRDKRKVILTSFFSNSVSVWDSRTDAVVEQYFDFNVPMNALRFRGDLVVAELGSGSVVLADGDDSSQRTTLISGLAVPAGLAGDRKNLYVGDWGTGQVWQVVRNRQVLADPILIAEGLLFPEGMEIDQNGDLLVAETGTGSLLRIRPRNGRTWVVADGLNIGRPALPGLVPTGIITGVAVGRHGDIYVAGDVDHVIYKIQE